MRITEVLFNDNLFQYDTLKVKCSQYINESQGLPLYRNLSTEYQDLHKVKVRHKKRPSALSEAFDQAFDTSNLTQRGIFGSSEIITPEDETEPFYIFPINNYKYLYCAEPNQTAVNFQETANFFVEQYTDETAADLMGGLLKYSYTMENLAEGIKQGAEVIMFDIPYYYAIRSTTVEYNQLYDFLSS